MQYKPINTLTVTYFGVLNTLNIGLSIRTVNLTGVFKNPNLQAQPPDIFRPWWHLEVLELPKDS